MPRARRTVLAPLLCAAAAAATVLVTAGASSADLMGRYQAGQQQAGQLQGRIAAEERRIQGFQGSIGSLQQRLNAVQRSVATQEQLLGSVTNQLSGDRTRLTALRATYAADLTALAAQLRAGYEAPPPTVIDVVVNARGFDQLINGISDLTTLERSNVATIRRLAAARAAVQAQTARLAGVAARRRRATAAVLVERDDIAQLKASIVERELVVQQAHARDTATLRALHHTLVHEASVLDARAARALASGGGAVVAPPGGCINTPFASHGGEFGFFPAPGTNYTVNEEPVIAARLDALGKALELHLIGISGYRSPEHSVEVGGFADDPHTRGEASDTPGVEGVAESTLQQFCLERPFPGAREADHIQELGSPL